MRGRPRDGEASAKSACSPGHFTVQPDGPLLSSTFTSTGIDSVTIDGSRVSLATSDGGCPPVEARFLHRKVGTIVLARWSSCPGFKGAVRLRAVLDPTCDSMKGTVTAKKAKVHQPFIAKQSTCATGQVTCGSAGVDLSSDPLNCVWCNAKCNSSSTCVGGHCVCATGTLCGNNCTDLTSDAGNCGQCGFAAPPGYVRQTQKN